MIHKDRDTSLDNLNNVTNTRVNVTRAYHTEMLDKCKDLTRAYQMFSNDLDLKGPTFRENTGALVI